MNDIFEYYTLKLTTKSPVHIGSGQTIGKKEFCLIPKKDKIRIMDMEKLIDYFVKEDPENLEWFEKFMIEDPSLRAKTRRAKDGTLYTGAECLDKKWLHTFLNLIAMPVPARKDCAMYKDISNAGIFQENMTGCDINAFMRNSDKEPYIPGSSVKGMLRTALMQQLIRKNRNKLTHESTIGYEEKDITEKLVNTLRLKYKFNEPDTQDAVNSIMRGIIISDSKPVSNDNIIVCKKIDRPPLKSQRKEKDFIEEKELKVVARECLKPDTEVYFRVKIDKRYFRPEEINMSFEELFHEMIKAFDEDYRKFYLSKFSKVEGSAADLEKEFLVLGGGSGYFGKNIIYTRYGFEKGLKKVSKYMREKDLDKDGKPKDKSGKMKNPDDYHLHGISPHMLKLTMYQGKMYHMGICDVTLERDNIE